MNKISNHPEKNKPFQWSKLAGKLNKGAKAKSEFNSRNRFPHRKDSSSSSDQESTTKVTSRQRQLLKSAAVPGVTYSGNKANRDTPEDKTKWLINSRQTDSIRSGSSSSLTERDHPTNSLSKQWPSTAQHRKFTEKSKGDWNSSAGSRESQRIDRGSAESCRKSEGGADLLVEAIRLGRKRQIKLLLDGGTDPNIQDHEGVTPLIAVVADVADSGLCSCLMQLLFDAGANPNIPDANGTTPLMHSVANNCYEAAFKLLQNEKTDPGIQNNEGFSALMLASSLGFTNIVLLILASFKKVHQITYLGQRNCEGLTAQDLAAKHGHSDIYHFLSSDAPIAGPKGLSGFVPAAHHLSRSPTPTDSLDLSDLDSSGDDHYTDVKDKSVRVSTPISDIELLDSLSLSYDSHKHRFLSLKDQCSSTDTACTGGNEADTESLMDDNISMGNTPTAGEGQEDSAEMSFPETKNPFYRGISEVVSPSISPEVISEEPTNPLNETRALPMLEEVHKNVTFSDSPEVISDRTDNKHIDDLKNSSSSMDSLGNISSPMTHEVSSQLPLRSLNEGRNSAFPKKFQEISPSISDDIGLQQPVRTLNGNLIIDRSSLERDGSNHNPIPVPHLRKEGPATLNPLVKITLPSPLKSMPSSLINDGMPKIEGGVANKFLNKSVKNLINEDFEMRPGYRPPTPARPSLPTLLGGKSESSQDSSVSSSSETLPKNRRITLAGFPRSTTESKAALMSQIQKGTQDDEVNSDMLNISTKSEGWDAMWGHRGRSAVFHSEGHVVPLPPIGQTVGGNVNEISSQNISDKESVLSVAKKTLERLENVLSPSEKLDKKKSSLPRSRTVHQLNMSP